MAWTRNKKWSGSGRKTVAAGAEEHVALIRGFIGGLRSPGAGAGAKSAGAFESAASGVAVTVGDSAAETRQYNLGFGAGQTFAAALIDGGAASAAMADQLVSALAEYGSTSSIASSVADGASETAESIWDTITG
jgi:hypothetical protein